MDTIESANAGIEFDHGVDKTSQQSLIKVDWNFILAELESAEDDMLKLHLRSEIVPLSRIVEIVDDKGFNLLHHAVLKGVPGKVDVLLDLFNSGIYE